MSNANAAFAAAEKCVNQLETEFKKQLKASGDLASKRDALLALMYEFTQNQMVPLLGAGWPKLAERKYGQGEAPEDFMDLPEAVSLAFDRLNSLAVWSKIPDQSHFLLLHGSDLVNIVGGKTPNGYLAAVAKYNKIGSRYVRVTRFSSHTEQHAGGPRVPFAAHTAGKNSEVKLQNLTSARQLSDFCKLFLDDYARLTLEAFRAWK